MGVYLNPGNEKFAKAVQSEIYVDKTGLIEYTNQVINTVQRYVCVSRPRRFGKSMTADMLTAYYGKECDSRELFSGLKISQNAVFAQHLNQYPTIFLNMQEFLSRSKEIGQVIDRVRRMLLREPFYLKPPGSASARKLTPPTAGSFSRFFRTCAGRSKRLSAAAVLLSSRRPKPSSRPIAAKATARSESPTDAVPIFPCQRGASSRSGASCTPTAPWPRLPCASGKTRPGKGKFAKFRLRPMRLHNEHASCRTGQPPAADNKSFQPEKKAMTMQSLSTTTTELRKIQEWKKIL